MTLRTLVMGFGLILVTACGTKTETDTTDETDTEISTTETDTETTETDTETTAVTPDCASWCSVFEDNCSDDPTYGFPSATACEGYCAAVGIPAGTADDVSGNTLGCRIYHAGAAAMDAATHCPHAGATGGDTCGSWEDNYCALTAAVCTGDNTIVYDPDCATEAEALDHGGDIGATSGDTIQCRMYHASAAITDADTHCPHAAAANAVGPCAPQGKGTKVPIEVAE